MYPIWEAIQHPESAGRLIAMASIKLITMVICYLRYLYCPLNVLKFNPSTAKKEGVKLPQSTFLHITQTSRPAAKFSSVTFPEYVFARNGARSWLPMTSRLRHDAMTCQSDVIVLRKMEIYSIYTFTRSGIMEQWIKHKLYHLKSEILWWHDVTHDNMSSHHIRDITSRLHEHKVGYLNSSISRCKLHYITLHYITITAFQTPPTPKVTSGASTITCYTKYSPPAQHAG